jgi:hypothetical protein
MTGRFRRLTWVCPLHACLAEGIWPTTQGEVRPWNELDTTKAVT